MFKGLLKVLWSSNTGSFDYFLLPQPDTTSSLHDSQHVTNPILEKKFHSPPSCSGYPPWILKRGVLEISGQRVISLNGKAKRLASCSAFFFFFSSSNFQEQYFFTFFLMHSYFQFVWPFLIFSGFLCFF